MEIEIKGLEPDKLNPHQYGGMCSRATVIFQRAADGNIDSGIDAIATTDAPAVVVDWERWELVREILPMKYAVLPKSDKVPLLDAHKRGSIKENLIGSARNWKADGTDLLAKLFVSKSEVGVRDKIMEGHIDSVSLGYETDSNQTVEIPKKAEVIIDGVSYKNEFEDDMPLLVRTWFKVKELSLVPIGADEAAKLKRAAEHSGISSTDPELQKKLDEAANQIKSLETKINSFKGGPNMAEQVEKTPEQLLKEERERVKAIETISERFSGNVTNMRQLKEDAIANGITELEFSSILLKNFNENKPIETPLGDVDLTERQLQDYSLMRALKAQLTKDWKGAGLEKEVSDAIAKKADKAPQGTFIPQRILNKGMLSAIRMNSRAAMTTTNAADIIKTELADNMWIALLRNKMVCRQAGAKVLSGLVGNLDIPKQLATGTFHWVAEQGIGTQTNLTVSKLSLTPKDGWAQQIYGRRTFLQTTPSIEALMFEDLNTLAALGLDYAGLMGPGTNSPTGIAHTNSVGSVAFGVAGTLTWPKMVEFESDVETNNADTSSMTFVTNPRVKAALKTTLKGTYQQYLMDPDGKTCNGYPVLSTNQTDAGVIIFGDFSQLIFAEWGLIDILVNPYSDNGDVKLTLFVTADVGVRQPGAFSVSTNAEA